MINTNYKLLDQTETFNLTTSEESKSLSENIENEPNAKSEPLQAQTAADESIKAAVSEAGVFKQENMIEEGIKAQRTHRTDGAMLDENQPFPYLRMTEELTSYRVQRRIKQNPKELIMYSDELDQKIFLARYYTLTDLASYFLNPRRDYALAFAYKIEMDKQEELRNAQDQAWEDFYKAKAIYDSKVNLDEENRSENLEDDDSMEAVDEYQQELDEINRYQERIDEYEEEIEKQQKTIDEFLNKLERSALAQAPNLTKSSIDENWDRCASLSKELTDLEAELKKQAYASRKYPLVYGAYKVYSAPLKKMSEELKNLGKGGALNSPFQTTEKREQELLTKYFSLKQKADYILEKKSIYFISQEKVETKSKKAARHFDDEIDMLTANIHINEHPPLSVYQKDCESLIAELSDKTFVANLQLFSEENQAHQDKYQSLIQMTETIKNILTESHLKMGV